MAGKKPRKSKKNDMPKIDAYIEGSGIVVNESISDTLKKNYMPYAMSVIISRALPEIDGFKPSHRKLLYTMYKMGLLSPDKERSKSANIVGSTMKLNPHGDQSIYETMVRLTRGNEALLHPYVDSKGTFGKAYSRNTRCAASRYTEAKLAPICYELFSDIDKETVDFVPNYDNTTTEPTLFPTTFPTILVNSNVGIAVSMASNICPFNLQEVCETTIALIKNPNHDIMTTIKGPDFPGGGFIVYDENEMRNVLTSGRGGIKVRSKYNYDKESNCIEITEIPYSTTSEAIIEKIVDLIKQGKIREISYIRDETGLSGLKIAIDLKRGTDPEKLMQKLFRLTPLQDNYPCNFNVLVAGTPRVMGVTEILNEWIAFRQECILRRTHFNLNKLKAKLHLLEGLAKILLDIDKAIHIIRETENEDDVIPNLMSGFEIDDTQANYVAEIKLRNINKQYILRRIQEVDSLKNEIDENESILADTKKVRLIIIRELKEVIKNYSQPRKTLFCYQEDSEEVNPEDEILDYPVNLFISESGYFKKITPQSLRMSGEHKLKDGDCISQSFETTNKTELIFFTDKMQAYKTKTYNFDDTKASLMGDYIPAKLGFDESENIVSTILTTNYEGYVIFVFENGKVAKIALKSYETKTNRKKLTNAYSDKSPIAKILFITDDCNILIRSNGNRALLFNTSSVSAKTTKNSQGVQVMNVKKNCVIDSAEIVQDDNLLDLKRYQVKNIPAMGALVKDDLGDSNQLKFE